VISVCHRMAQDCASVRNLVLLCVAPGASSASLRASLPNAPPPARVAKWVGLRSTAGNCAWAQTPQLTRLAQCLYKVLLIPSGHAYDSLFYSPSLRGASVHWLVNVALGSPVVRLLGWLGYSGSKCALVRNLQLTFQFLSSTDPRKLLHALTVLIPLSTPSPPASFPPAPLFGTMVYFMPRANL